MKNQPTFYEILHVQPDAPSAVIKASYRTMMQRLKMHPDLGGDHAQAVSINEAFATLIDPARRTEYDRQLQLADRNRGRAEPAPQPSASAPPPRPPAPSRDTAACGFCEAPCPAGDAEWSDGACATCGSPLFSAEKHEAGADSRRAIERVPRNMPMTFRLAKSRHQIWTGTTEDVSLNGMRFLSRIEIPIGERLRIECDFCSAVGVVTSSRRHTGNRPGRWQCGVEFSRLRIKHARGGLFSTVA